MAKDKFWYIPCRLNRASLGDSEIKFVVLTDLARQPNRPAWVPIETVQIWPQRMPIGGRFKGYVLGKEVGRRGNILTLEIVSHGNPEYVNISRSLAISEKQYGRSAGAEKRRAGRGQIRELKLRADALLGGRRG